MDIDLNADVGEGFGRWTLTDDAALLTVVSSANVACGFHAGDAATMRAVCAAAARAGVAVGAQVSYRDLAGFGRRFLDVDPAELCDEVVYQAGALQALARSVATRVTYVKPHGALHAATVRHEGQARAVVDAVRALRGVLGEDVAVLGAPGSLLLAYAAEAGLRSVVEAFPDRGYAADGTLLPRGTADALVDDPDEVAARAVRLARDGVVRAADGTDVAVRAASLCVHGDAPAAVATARAVRAALEAAGLTVRPFAAAEDGPAWT